MDVLRAIHNHPSFGRLKEAPEVKRMQILHELNYVKRLVRERNISGTEVVNGYGDSHYKECCQANINEYEDFDFVGTCVCCTIGQKTTLIFFMLDQLQLSTDKAT